MKHNRTISQNTKCDFERTAKKIHARNSDFDTNVMQNSVRVSVKNYIN